MSGRLGRTWNVELGSLPVPGEPVVRIIYLGARRAKSEQRETDDAYGRRDVSDHSDGGGADTAGSVPAGRVATGV